jgi:hypothetical protein
MRPGPPHRWPGRHSNLSFSAWARMSPVISSISAISRSAVCWLKMPEHRAGWSREFYEPIALPDGTTVVTLRDAAGYITGLPDAEAVVPEWHAAIEALMLVADLGGPTMFARIGMIRALNRHHVREFNPARKDHRWGRRKLKRDQ